MSKESIRHQKKKGEKIEKERGNAGVERCGRGRASQK